MMKLNKKAQNTLEYAVLIAVVAGALIAMQIYMKRAVQGHLQSSADDVGEQFSISGLMVYNYSFNTSSNTTEIFKSGETESNLTSPEVTTKTFNLQLSNLSNETWD